jgi:hypothetical protein
MMQHIARWLIHSGVGYTDFVAALKPIFYDQALAELERIQQNKTDSAVSLLSGLHRKDVSAFRQQANQINAEANRILPLVSLLVSLHVGLHLIYRIKSLSLATKIVLKHWYDIFQPRNIPAQFYLNYNV